MCMMYTYFHILYTDNIVVIIYYSYDYAIVWMLSIHYLDFSFTIIISLFIICISTNIIVTMTRVFLLKLPKFLKIAILPSFLTVW